MSEEDPIVVTGQAGLSSRRYIYEDSNVAWMDAIQLLELSEGALRRLLMDLPKEFGRVYNATVVVIVTNEVVIPPPSDKDVKL